MKTVSLLWRSSLSAVAMCLALLCVAPAGHSAAAATASNSAASRVQFRLGADCMCASCSFSTQAMLRKLPGVKAVSVSEREKLLSLTYDDARTPLSQVAATLNSSPLGKDVMLIGRYTPGAAVPDARALESVPGIKSASVDPRKAEVLLKLSPAPRQTGADLAAALSKIGSSIRIIAPAS